MTDTNSVTSEEILKRTSQEMVDVIYDTLEVIDRILRSAKIDYTIFCGTMLGSQRHGGLIPWDDDGDIAIQRKDEEKLLTLTKTFADQGYVLAAEPEFGYRVWDPCRTIVRVCDQLRIPFVDIFLMDNEFNKYVYITESAKIYFPGEPLPFGCFQRLIDVPFGHLILRGLNFDDAKQHLNENLGTDWNEVAWRDFDHVTADVLPKIRVTLDRPDLLHPALHSQHNDFKTLKSIINCVEDDRSDL
jgi:lipopolysaccharide cholinephosphotransferase